MDIITRKNHENDHVFTVPVATFLFVLSSLGGFFFLPSEPCLARDSPQRSLSS
jgi:hypothetical protein